MSVDLLTALELVEGTRPRVFDRYAKVRVAHFTMPPVTVAHDATSTINLVKLPFGAVRLFPSLSRFAISALGASRTLDFGYRAFSPRPVGTADEAEDLDALAADIDVSSALADTAWATTLKYDFYSTAGVQLCAQVNDGTIPIGATFSGFAVFATE